MKRQSSLSLKLFNLIHALTASERRYFSIFSVKHVIGEKNKYAVLFGIIKDLASYSSQSEEWIRMRLAKKKITKDIPNLKDQLYSLVLRSVREYRSEKTVEIRLRELLDDAQFLLERGLYEEFGEILVEAKETAYSYEEYLVLLKILDMERALAYDSEGKNLKKRIAEIQAEKNEVLRKLDNLCAYQKLYDQVVTQTRINPTNPEQEKTDALSAIIQNPLLLSENETLSFEARCYFLSTHSQYNLLLNKPEEAYSYQQRLRQHWREYPHRIKNSPQRYLKVLSNLAGVCLRLKHYGEFQAVLQELRDLPVFSYDEEGEKFQNRAHLELYYSLVTLQLKEAQTAWPSIEQDIVYYQKKINPARELTLYYNASILFFASENFGKCCKVLLRIHEHKKREVRRDILIFSHLLFPVIHYELHNFDILENLCRDSERYLTSVEHLRAFEQNLLNELRELPDVQNIRGRQAAFGRIKQELENLLLSHPLHLGLQELWCWAESRITGRTILSVLEERRNTRN